MNKLIQNIKNLFQNDNSEYIQNKWLKENHLYEYGDRLIFLYEGRLDTTKIELFLPDKFKANGRWADLSVFKNSNYINWSLLVRKAKKIEKIINKEIEEENELKIYSNSLNYIKNNLIYIDYYNQFHKIFNKQTREYLPIRFKLYNENYWIDGNLIEINDSRYLLINFQNILGKCFKYLEYKTNSNWLNILGDDYYKKIILENSEIEYNHNYYSDKYTNYYYHNYIFYIDINDIEKIEIKDLSIIKKNYQKQIQSDIRKNEIEIINQMLDNESKEYKKELTKIN